MDILMVHMGNMVNAEPIWTSNSCNFARQSWMFFLQLAPIIILPFPKQSIMIIFWEFQKTMDIIFAADRTVFSFFSALLPIFVNYFDCYLDGGSKIPSTVTCRCKKNLRITIAKHCVEMSFEHCVFGRQSTIAFLYLIFQFS